MKPIKIVFDSNVYLAATKPNSYAQAQLRKAEPTGPFELFISPEIITEVRSKLETRFGYSPEDSAKYIKMILRYAKVVQPAQRVSGVLSDKDDHKILECALEARADLIITADRGLLKLKTYKNIKIAHPSMLKYWFK